MHQYIAFLLQHWVLSLAFLFVFLAIVLVQMLDQMLGAAKVDAQALVQLMNNEKVVVVDLRAKEAYLKGHIIHAINVPFQGLQKDFNKLSSHKNNLIVLVCEIGQQAGSLAGKLMKDGFTKVKILKNGMKGWGEASLPLEK